MASLVKLLKQGQLVPDKGPGTEQLSPQGITKSKPSTDESSNSKTSPKALNPLRSKQISDVFSKKAPIKNAKVWTVGCQKLMKCNPFLKKEPQKPKLIPEDSFELYVEKIHKMVLDLEQKERMLEESLKAMKGDFERFDQPFLKALHSDVRMEKEKTTTLETEMPSIAVIEVKDVEVTSKPPSKYKSPVRSPSWHVNAISKVNAKKLEDRKQERLQQQTLKMYEKTTAITRIRYMNQEEVTLDPKWNPVKRPHVSPLTIPCKRNQEFRPAEQTMGKIQDTTSLWRKPYEETAVFKIHEFRDQVRERKREAILERDLAATRKEDLQKQIKWMDEMLDSQIERFKQADEINNENICLVKFNESVSRILSEMKSLDDSYSELSSKETGGFLEIEESFEESASSSQITPKPSENLVMKKTIIKGENGPKPCMPVHPMPAPAPAPNARPAHLGRRVVPKPCKPVDSVPVPAPDTRPAHLGRRVVSKPYKPVDTVSAAAPDSRPAHLGRPVAPKPSKPVDSESVPSRSRPGHLDSSKLSSKPPVSSKAPPKGPILRRDYRLLEDIRQDSKKQLEERKQKRLQQQMLKVYEKTTASSRMRVIQKDGCRNYERLNHEGSLNQRLKPWIGCPVTKNVF